MTIEEAIGTIKTVRADFEWAYPYRDTTGFDMAIKALEDKDVLDKIRAEIFNACSDSYHMPVYKLSCEEIFEIIDKYKAESEGV